MADKIVSANEGPLERSLNELSNNPSRDSLLQSFLKLESGLEKTKMFLQNLNDRNFRAAVEYDYFCEYLQNAEVIDTSRQPVLSTYGKRLLECESVQEYWQICVEIIMANYKHFEFAEVVKIVLKNYETHSDLRAKNGMSLNAKRALSLFVFLGIFEFTQSRHYTFSKNGELVIDIARKRIDSSSHSQKEIEQNNFFDKIERGISKIYSRFPTSTKFVGWLLSLIVAFTGGAIINNSIHNSNNITIPPNEKIIYEKESSTSAIPRSYQNGNNASDSSSLNISK